MSSLNLQSLQGGVEMNSLAAYMELIKEPIQITEFLNEVKCQKKELKKIGMV